MSFLWVMDFSGFFYFCSPPSFYIACHITVCHWFIFLGNSILEPVFSVLFSFLPSIQMFVNLVSPMYISRSMWMLYCIQITQALIDNDIRPKKKSHILCHTDGWIFVPMATVLHIWLPWWQTTVHYCSPKLTSGLFLTGKQKGPLQWSQARIKQQAFQPLAPTPPTHTHTHPTPSHT